MNYVCIMKFAYITYITTSPTSLQAVQNAAARVVTLTPRHVHITPILINLHWLPVEFRITFKVLLLVYKALHGLAPSYISDLLNFKTYSRSLRSSCKEYLVVPRSRLKTYGDRAFSIAIFFFFILFCN